jgi:hypothetical protein
MRSSSRKSPTQIVRRWFDLLEVRSRYRRILALISAHERRSRVER